VATAGGFGFWAWRFAIIKKAGKARPIDLLMLIKYLFDRKIRHIAGRSFALKFLS
jgi:hypothetical protein